MLWVTTVSCLFIKSTYTITGVCLLFLAVPASILHYSAGNVGSSRYVHTLQVLSKRKNSSHDHSSLRWLQRFRNGDRMLARWYLLLGQFSVKFEYRPGAQHPNADGMSRQCGQSQRPDCPVSAKDSPTPENNEEMEIHCSGSAVRSVGNG